MTIIVSNADISSSRNIISAERQTEGEARQQRTNDDDAMEFAKTVILYYTFSYSGGAPHLASPSHQPLPVCRLTQLIMSIEYDDVHPLVVSPNGILCYR